MDENDFDSRAWSGKRKERRNLDDENLYLLRGEEQLLQSISVRAPLPRILNEICSALDCEIANVVSFISLSEDIESELAEVAMNAALFGLHVFCSKDVATEDGETLGSLEMYCGARQAPSERELQLIERAKCLAAIAIKRYNEAGQPIICETTRNRPAQGGLLGRPICRN